MGCGNTLTGDAESEEAHTAHTPDNLGDMCEEINKLKAYHHEQDYERHEIDYKRLCLQGPVESNRSQIRELRAEVFKDECDKSDQGHQAVKFICSFALIQMPEVGACGKIHKRYTLYNQIRAHHSWNHKNEYKQIRKPSQYQRGIAL